MTLCVIYHANRVRGISFIIGLYTERIEMGILTGKAEEEKTSLVFSVTQFYIQINEGVAETKTLAVSSRFHFARQGLIVGHPEYSKAISSAGQDPEINGYKITGGPNFIPQTVYRSCRHFSRTSMCAGV